MADGKFISYLRVSTDRQGKSGLGIEAQRAAVTAYLNGGNWSVIAEIVEVESGKNNERPQLAAAIASCRLYGAKLLIAKLDRLSRDAVFLLGLERAGVEFVCADMPAANRLTVGIMAMVADEERRMISARTKAALAAAKARGTKLGGFREAAVAPTAAHAAASLAVRQAKAALRATGIQPVIIVLRNEGITTLGGIAKALTARGIPTSRGSATWAPAQVARVMALMS